MGTLEDFLKRHGYKAETQADNENEENGELDAFYSRHNYDPNKNTKTTESPTASANVENRELNAFYSRHNYDPNKDTTKTAGQGNPAQPKAVLQPVVKPSQMKQGVLTESTDSGKHNSVRVVPEATAQPQALRMFTNSEGGEDSFGSKSHDEQKTDIFGTIGKIEGFYTPEITVGSGDPLHDAVYGTQFSVPKFTGENKTKQDPATAKQLWDDLQRQLAYVMYSGNYTEAEAQKIADSVYRVKAQYEDNVSNDAMLEVMYWSYGDTAEDFMKEYRYQHSRGITKESLPYKSVDQLLTAVKRSNGDDTSTATGYYLANMPVSAEDENKILLAFANLKEKNRDHPLVDDWITARRSNGTEGNADGMRDALKYQSGTNFGEVAGEAVGTGNDIAVENIFNRPGYALDQATTHLSGYLWEGFGSLLYLMGFQDAGDTLYRRGEKDLAYREPHLQASEQILYNRQRDYGEITQKIENKTLQWIADMAPGLLASTLQMGASSLVGGVAQAGATPFTTAFGSAASNGSRALNATQYDALTRAMGYGIKNAGLFAMSGNAALDVYSMKVAAGDEPWKAMLYGLADGAAEFGSELMFGGNPLLDSGDAGAFTRLVYRLTDNGSYSSITKTWLECLRNGEWGALLQKFITSGTFDMMGEGFEEIISSVGMMGMDYALYGKTDVTPESLATDFASGVLLSMVLTGGEKLIGRLRPVNADGEYRHIKFFTEEQQNNFENDMQAARVQMAEYVLGYLGGDVELLKANGMTEEQANQAAKDFQRILTEYSQIRDRGNAYYDMRDENGNYKYIRYFTEEQQNDADKANEAMLQYFAQYLGGDKQSLLALGISEQGAENLVKEFQRIQAEYDQITGMLDAEEHAASEEPAQQAEETPAQAQEMPAQAADIGIDRRIFTEDTAAEDAQSVVEAYRRMTQNGTLQNRSAAEELLKAAEAATSIVNNAEARGRLMPQEAYDSELALRQVIESAKAILNENTNTPAQITTPETTIGGMDNGRTEGVTDGAQRNESVGADQQGRAVAEGTGARAERGRTASLEVRRALAAGEFDLRSPKEAGIKGGSQSQTMQILRDSAVERIDELRQIRDEAAKDGLRVVFFGGTCEVYNKYAKGNKITPDGIYDPDTNTVYLKADQTNRSAAQLYNHEMMHNMLRENPEMRGYLANLLAQAYTPEGLDRLIAQYCKAYRGCYGTFTESMTEDEYNALYDMYLDELLADAYALIRRGDINTVKAEQAMAAFRSDPTDGGRENAAATERTNGPGENNTADTEAGGKVMYSVEEYDPETASLKEQLDNAQVELKQMQVVTNQRIDLSEIQFASKVEAKAWANKALRRWNGRVDRQGFGEIFFSKSNIDYAIEHLSDRYQQAAFCALPYVLKRGIQIGEHNDHRGRGKHTITFAAPIEINGTRGNMAVVVNIHGKHAYAARVLLPDGTAFVFGEMKETPQGMHQGVLKNESLADTTSGASNTRIADSSEDVKQRFSIEDDSEYSNLAEKYRDGTASEEETAKLQELVDQAAKDAGFSIKAYHGTQRADRVGTVFRPDRSTSGPMAFFTDNRSIAENYARDKADTSLAYDSDYDSYETQFRFRNGKDAKYPIDAPIAKAWGYIPFADRAKILRNAGNLHFDWDGETGREFILDKDTNEAGGGFQWQLKEHRGNVIAALIEQWLNSANLFEEEGRFLDVLKMTGVTDALKSVGLELYYKDPNYREDKVYDTWLKITQPFDVTTQVNEAFVEGFEEWYNEQDQSKYERESVSADFWDKNNVTAEMFAERMRDDIERNQSHAWTSIPDSATDYLKHLGYNGIKDTGGKNGGDIHTVWVPFSSDQVRSADPVTYDDEGNIIPLSERFRTDRTGEEAWKNNDIRYSVEDDAAELDEAYKRAVQRDAAEDEPTEKGRSFLPQRDPALGPDYASIGTEEIERRAREATLQQLRNMEQRAEEELNRYRWAKRHGILTAEMEKRMKTVEDTVKIQNEELKHKNAEERKQRQKRQDEEAKRQQPRIAKKELKAKLAESFHVAPGQRAITNDLIEQAANKILQRGYLDAEDKRSLFNALLKSGVVNIAPEGYYGEIRSYVQQGRIYVPESVREEFGDDWNDFHKRAWGNRIYLTSDTTDRPIDDWNQDLAEMFPGGFEEGATDMKEALEQIVALAEEGSAENITIAEMMERNKDNYGWTVESQMEGLEDQLDAALKSFAETAGVEIRVRQEKATEVLKERRRMREMIERESARRRESEQRNRVMKQIRQLNRMRNRTAPEIQAQIDEVLNGIDTVARSISDRGLEDLIDLAKAYEQAKADNPNFIPNPYVEARLARLQQTQLDNMKIEDVIELGRVVSALVHSVQEANRLHSEEYKAEMDATARNFVEEMQAAKGSKGGKLYEWAVNNHLSPVRFIRHLGGWIDGGASAQIAQSLENGQTRQMRYLMEASQIFDKFTADKENRKWLEKASGKNAEWIKVSVPVNYDVNENDQTEIKWQDVEITPMMRVALYMHSLNGDNLRHIMGGGMTIPNKAYYVKGDMQNAYAYGTRVKMTPETVRSIVKDMTEQERTFAGLLREYYDRYSKDHINEVSMILDGFERAGGENYYHIKTDQNFLSKLPDNIQKNISLESIGSIVNERVFSKVPIVLEDASVSLADHIQQISKYYGFAVPIHDFTAIMNFTDHETGNIFSGSVRELMGQQWGAGAQKYLNKLMEDLQSSSGINEMTATFLGNLRGKLAGASLMFNPAVALSQFASYPGAMQTLGAKALAEGLRLWERTDMDLIGKYSPLLWYRNQGNSTQELGDYMDGQTMEHKLPWLLGWIQKIDSFTVRRLWAAAEYYVSNNTDLRPGSEAEIAAGTDEYYQKVAEMFNRAVYDTQPNYSTMQRPQILRSNSDLTKFLTMFKTVPLQYYNMMFEAAGRLSNAKRRGNAEEIRSAAGYFARTAVGLVTANAFYVFVKSLFKVFKHRDKKYRDEEGNWDWGEYFKQFGLDVADTFAGGLIGGAELLDAVEQIVAAVGGEKQRYNGVDINAISFLSSIVQDALDLSSAIGELDGKDLASAIKGILKDGVMGTLGLPAENAETYLLALTKWISPETAERYENLFSDRGKSSLSEEHGRYLEAAISVYMDNRTEDLPDEVKQELQRLWEAGQKNAIPSAVPSSVTVGGESIALTSAQKAQFREEWSRIVSDNLEALIGTEYYQDADETTQGKMIDRLYQYAAQTAKSNLDIGFTADRWVTAADEENLQEYLTYCTLRSMMDRQADEATNTAAVTAVMDYVIGGISEDDSAEIARLYMNGAEGLIPTLAPEEFTYKDENGTEHAVMLDAAARKQFNETYREAVGDQISVLMSSPEYANTDDKTRAALIGKVFDFAAGVAKAEAAPDFTPEKWIVNGMENMEDGIRLADYIIYNTERQHINGKNEDGDTESGLKDRRTFDLIDSNDWTDDQKISVYLDTCSTAAAGKVQAMDAAGFNWKQIKTVMLADKPEYAVLEANISDNAKLKVLGEFCNESKMTRYQTGKMFGVSFADYAEVMQHADTNGKGSISQDEATAYIKSMGLYPQQAAYLWQMVTDGKNGKNNPFSPTWGAEFYYEMHKNDNN